MTDTAFPTNLLPLSSSFVSPLELEASADGAHYLLVGNDQFLRVLDAQDFLVQRMVGSLIDATPLFATCVSWSPDSRHFVAGYANGTVCIWNIANLEQPVQAFWGRHADMVLRVRWSHDGNCIASLGEEGLLNVFDAFTGEQRFVYAGPNRFAPPRDITWSPDGQRLAVACADDTVSLLDAITGATLTAYECPGLIECLVWEPSGPAILILLQNQTACLWFPDESRFHSLFTLLRPLRAAVWSPDSTKIAIAAEHEVMVWRREALAKGQVLPEMLVPSHNIQAVSWSPGNMLVFSTGASGVFALHLDS